LVQNECAARQREQQEEFLLIPSKTSRTAQSYVYFSHIPPRNANTMRRTMLQSNRQYWWNIKAKGSLVGARYQDQTYETLQKKINETSIVVCSDLSAPGTCRVLQISRSSLLGVQALGATAANPSISRKILSLLPLASVIELCDGAQ
jgi:hypothetical protein